MVQSLVVLLLLKVIEGFCAIFEDASPGAPWALLRCSFSATLLQLILLLDSLLNWVSSLRARTNLLFDTLT